ncbi:MAG: PepSY-associated TM helix domain-containing protein, partial [Vicinamibacterales bacterium]
MLRKVIFWLHLSAGLVAGIVILIMSVTGVLLTYEKQMIAWADRSDLARPPLPTSERQPVDALISAARRGDASVTVTNLTISSVPGAPALATVGSRVITLNPYTGAVLGESAPRLRGFFRTVTTWHRYLGAANGPLRQTLRSITGWSNFFFLLIVLGGIYLWLPRRWGWTQVRAVALFRGGIRGKARDFNWHNVIGIWSAVPLALIVAGAVPISFQWANRAIYQAVGEDPPVPQAPPGGLAGGACGT